MIDMELDPEDKEVVDLLSKLKDSNGTYPSDILAARRQTYLRQIANAGLGLGVGTGIKNAAQSGSGAGGTTATITSKILEAALIAAIAIEAGTIVYVYRDKIADLVRTYTGSANVQEIASPATDSSSSNSEFVVNTGVPSVTATTPSGTVTVTSGTPSPEVAGDNNSSDTNASVNATPSPGDNNGNQFGLTPKPERTKENNNNIDGGTSNNNGGGNNNNSNGNNNKP